MYKLKMDNPALPSGTEVQIHGLGFIKNGHEEIIDDERAEAFRGANQVQRTVEATEQGTIVVTEKGPTLLQAFKGHPFVTVETYSPSKEKKAKSQDDDNSADDERPADGDHATDDNQGEGE